MVQPFAAYRPAPGLAAKIAAPPYDVVNAAEARAIAENNPYCFLRVDKAEIELDENISPYDDKVYQKAAKNLQKLINENALIYDETPRFYAYRLIRAGRSQTGLVCCVPVDAYLSGKIKKNENTREDKERDRIRHIETTQAHTGPIFLSYNETEKNSDISYILSKTAETTPLYDFNDGQNVRHIVWQIEEEAEKQLISLFKNVDSLYIADGHHRTAAAAKTALKMREENSPKTGYNNFLAVVFPSHSLCILDYNRVVRTLNGLSNAQFLTALEKDFEVTKIGTAAYAPTERHTFGLCLSNASSEFTWYSLKFRQNPTDILQSLDVSILSDYVLTPVLGIKDIRTDKNIDFVGGGRGLPELERLVKGEFKAAFSMFPTSMDELTQIADAGLLMPPKSTWFEPKLLSGLFVHRL